MLYGRVSGGNLIKINLEVTAPVIRPFGYLCELGIVVVNVALRLIYKLLANSVSYYEVPMFDEAVDFSGRQDARSGRR